MADPVNPPYVEVPAFGPLNDINVKAFTRGEFSYNQVKANASGSNEVGTGSSGSTISDGGGGGGDCCTEVYSALDQLAAAIEEVGLAVSDLQSRIENAEIVAECDGNGNIQIQMLL